MTGRGKAEQLARTLDRLEASYGKLVPCDDPVGAGVLALLAEHAPRLSTPETRDRLREAFCDWNEMRVADPWDVTVALDAGGEPDALAFARAAVRFLESVAAVLHRTSFDAVRADPSADAHALLDRMRGATPPVRAVVLAALDPAGAWHPGAEMSKVLQKLGFAGKTTSPAKAGKDAQDVADPADRLRAHYVLTRYGCRSKDEADPLAASSGGRRASKGERPAKASKAKPAKA